MSETTKRDLFADYVRVIATFAVILLHSSGDLLYSFGKPYYQFDFWMTGNVFDSATRWSVPVFAMLSGALLLRPKYTESIGNFLQRRMLRVFIPYLFWSVIYTLYMYRYNIRDWQTPHWPDVWNKILFDEVYYHLWFVPMILGLYFVTPIFRVLVRHATRFEIEYFITLWFVTSIISAHFPDFFMVRYMGWFAYTGYFLLGDYIVTYPFSLRVRQWIYALGIAGLALTIFGTWLGSEYFGYFFDRLYIYLSINVVLTSVAVFTYLKYVNWAAFATRFPRINHIVLYLSGISFGIYLCHVVIMDCLKNGYIWSIKIYTTSFMNHDLHPIVCVPLFCLVVVFMSILLINVLIKIPFIKKIVV